MTTNNYVTFICDKYATIHRDNGYCKEEELFGQYLSDEFDKRCNYATEEYFLDYGFAINFKIGNKIISSLLTVVNDNNKKFAISTSSTLNKIEKFIGISDEKEHSYINQILDDILRLDNSISEISWSLIEQADLNADEED
jgi:hypothetical protein